MKIQLVEEVKLGEDPWYAIYMDGRYVKGSSVKERALEYYETLKSLGDAALVTHKKVLLSNDTDVNLQEKSH
jgi:hypothetical protein